MTANRMVKAGMLAAGLLFLAAGAGWAYYGADIFLSLIMAGIAYCI